MCGVSRDEAMRTLAEMERVTAPAIERSGERSAGAI
jgi:hypothetical protein